MVLLVQSPLRSSSSALERPQYRISSRTRLHCSCDACEVLLRHEVDLQRDPSEHAAVDGGLGGGGPACIGERHERLHSARQLLWAQESVPSKSKFPVLGIVPNFKKQNLTHPQLHATGPVPALRALFFRSQVLSRRYTAFFHIIIRAWQLSWGSDLAVVAGAEDGCSQEAGVGWPRHEHPRDGAVLAALLVEVLDHLQRYAQGLGYTIAPENRTCVSNPWAEGFDLCFDRRQAL